MAEERTIAVGPVDLVVLEAGTGGRPLLLVHGFTGAKEDFRDVVDPLAAEGYWVVAPDLRGHGSSTQLPDEADYLLERFVDDVEGLVPALGWEQADVLGHSMGGMVVQVLALRRPELVSRLVLMDTGPGQVEGMDQEIMQLGVDLCRAEGLEAVLAVQQMGEPALDSAAHRRMLEEDPTLEAWETSKFLSCSPAMWASVVTQLMSVEDRLDALRGLAVPTLVIVGDQDTSFLAASEALAGAIAGARLVVVPDVGHSPQLENPTAWYDAVSSFLASSQPVAG